MQKSVQKFYVFPNFGADRLTTDLDLCLTFTAICRMLYKKLVQVFIMKVINSKNRDVIAAAALELFKANGYESVSVSEICRRANVPRSSFYSAFGGKEDIIIYMMKNLKEDYASVFSQLMEAENDLCRIWALYDRYLGLAVEFGPDLTGALFALELRNPVGILDLIYAFNDWFVKLIKSCQRQGLIRNATPPEDIVTLGVRIALGAAYEWCRTRGAFDLRQTALSEHETLYDVPPEYRRYSKR